MSDHEKCEDCPNIIERREQDATFKENIIGQLSGLTVGVAALKDSVILWRTELIEQRNDIKRLTWRLAFLAGGAGTIGGAVAALVSLHLHGG
jgi:hypothetical protein